MSISEISLYKALRIKLGDEAANDLVEFVASEVKTELDNKTNIFLTKEDKIDLIDRINKAKTETIIWIVGIGVLQFILTIPV
jgi:predicted DNA-binding helix-hairpin-helix protein